MGEFAIGQPVPRTEDPRLLTGGGKFVDDVKLLGEAHANILRSPHAHARILAIGTDAAKAAPGVLAVLTGQDYAADGLGYMPCTELQKRRDGSPMFLPPHPALVLDQVKRVGDAVALVIAETVAQAKDAAERIEVEYEPLPSVTSAAEAAMPGAQAVWEACTGNICYYHEQGDKVAVEAAFAKADCVVRRRFKVNRVSANTMEPRGCIGDYDWREDRYTVYTGLQNPHQVREQIARGVFGVAETQLRIMPGDIGGSFGLRGGTYPEIVMVLWASKIVGRPVKWVCERSEGLLSDHHARDNFSDVALALDKNGNFLALDVSTTANMGAYLAVKGPRPPVGNLGTLAGVYTTPLAHVSVTAVFTNTNPTNPYRGSGAPEAAYITERLIDIAARELGIDPAELRRRNLIAHEAMPFTNALGYTYDCGAFEKGLDGALEMADYAGFEARRAAARKRGKLRGIGLSHAVKKTSIPVIETAEIRFDPSGTATLLIGTISHGQGHETIYKQIMCDRLGLLPERIRIVESDTDLVTYGGGTFGSRSAALGGSAIVRAAEKIEAKARRIAAHLLEAAKSDLTFEDGAFIIAGTDRSVTLVEVAKAAYTPPRLPSEIEPGLDETAAFAPEGQNWPNGCHICEVEIDPDTGTHEIVRYTAVDDVGTVLNPLLYEAQIHGGVVQGLGQALMEEMVFENGTGQLLSGSFMDYCMPRADDLCFIDQGSEPVPTRTNPLGVKGAGESGPVAALPAAINAVIDALKPLGVDHIDPPATPERIWRAVREAEGRDR